MLVPRLTVTGIDETLAQLEGLERQLALSLVVELEWFGRSATQEMQALHSFQNITGRLERSIGYTVENWGIPDKIKIVCTVFALAPYAQAVEAGTPHSRPYPFFWPVYYQYLPELMARLQTAIDETMTEAGKTSTQKFSRASFEMVGIRRAA